MLSAVETAAIGRMFMAKHGGRLDANKEFLALAAPISPPDWPGFPGQRGHVEFSFEGGGDRTPLARVGSSTASAIRTMN